MASTRLIRLRLPGSVPGRVTVRVGRRLARAIAADLARERPGVRVVLVADARAARRHAAPLLGALRRRGVRPEMILIGAPERTKTREGKAALEDRLLRSGAGRDTLIIAFGGGALLDLAGFTAATYMRGIPWIALPTTLLGMADASVGGKVAVNHPLGKNLLGAFHHPEAVYADLAWLDSLPDRAYRAGLAEIVKMAAGLSAPLFRVLEGSAPELLHRRPALLGDVIARSVALKSRMVSRDEREAGARQGLNFGHTIGHALETAEPGRWLHGEAVALGLVVESAIASRVSGFPPEAAARITALLRRLGLPVHPPDRFDPRRLIRLTRSDKKVRRGLPRYALPRRIGQMSRAGTGEWTHAVPDALVLACWDDAVRISSPGAGSRGRTH